MDVEITMTIHLRNAIEPADLMAGIEGEPYPSYFETLRALISEPSYFETLRALISEASDIYITGVKEWRS